MKTISEVLDELDKIIEHCQANNSRQAYFAALYRAMTHSVKAAIENGYFANGPRMEQLDVTFAKRYIDAWECNSKDNPCSKSWQTAFSACNNSKLVVLQHLLLGINAHINLDLAIAAAATAPGESIYDLQADFEKINSLIASLTDVVQARLEMIWWPMKFLKRISNGKEQAVINFSINTARRTSWASAVALATFSGDAAGNYIQAMDVSVNTIAQRIMEPGFFTDLLLMPVRWFEYKDITRIITVLNQPLPVYNYQ